MSSQSRPDGRYGPALAMAPPEPGSGFVARRRGTWRGTGLVAALLLLLAAVPVLALPAARCAALGIGCREPNRPGTPPAATSGAPRPLTPLEAATRGRYVALGDSYASGEGTYASPAELAASNRCHRTPQAYFHTITRTFRFAGGAAFWACSGATTFSFVRGKSGEPAQTGRVGPGTSLVTLSLGGNDVGFSKVLSRCVVKVTWGAGCRDQAGEIAGRMAELRRTLPSVLGSITTRAPAARVIVLGYPRIFSEISGSGFDNISVGDQQWLNARGRDLNELIRQAATEADRRVAAAGGKGSVEFVDAYSGFAGHEIGSADPFVNGLDVDLSAFAVRARSFHPTVRGYQRLAELFDRQIRTGPGRLLGQYR